MSARFLIKFAILIRNFCYFYYASTMHYKIYVKYNIVVAIHRSSDYCYIFQSLNSL